MTTPTFHWFLPMHRDSRSYGGDPSPREATPRYLRDVARAAEAVDYYRVSRGGRPAPVSQRPTIFFGGLSEEAAEVGAAHADVQLMYGETPPMAAEHVERISKLAAGHGREIEFGIPIQVITRDRGEDAWAETDRILAKLTPAQVARRQRELAERQSIGQRRVQSLNPGVIDRERLRPYPTIWSGLGPVGGGGGGTALVGLL